jgi:hypothetical protein
MQARFVYTVDFESKLESALSRERLDTYREILPSGTSFIDLIGLYNANTAVSEALMGSIQIMEISVRNSIHTRVTKDYGIEWYIDNRIGLDKDGRRLVTRSLVALGVNPISMNPAIEEQNFTSRSCGMI